MFRALGYVLCDREPKVLIVSVPKRDSQIQLPDLHKFSVHFFSLDELKGSFSKFVIHQQHLMCNFKL